MTDTVLIIDFGSQVTQLIARRVREQGVYSEIVPFNRAQDALERLKPKAVILSGGPASVTEFGTPRAPDWVFEAGLPVLGICYGEQTMVAQLGGGVEGGHHREFGRAELRGHRRYGPVRRRVGQGRDRHGVDEPRRPRHPAARRLQGGGRLQGRPVRGHRRREAPALRRAVPPRGGAHPARGRADRQLRAPHRRAAGRLEHGALQVERDRQDPRPGRQGPRHLRPLGRRRQRRGRGADPRGRSATSSPASSSTTACCGRTRPRRWSRCSAATTTSRWCTSTPASGS